MQTSLLLPLILIVTNGPGLPEQTAATAHVPVVNHVMAENAANQRVSVSVAAARKDPLRAIFEGCRPPVLDPRQSSKILFRNRVASLDASQRIDLPDAEETPLFISRCGSEFVLFPRRPEGESGDLLYLRFEEGSFELLDEVWG